MPKEHYLIQVAYEIITPIHSLTIFWSEYDNSKMIKSLSANLPNTVGKHKYHLRITLSENYKAFRIFLGLKALNQKVNSKLCVEGMTIFRVL